MEISALQAVIGLGVATVVAIMSLAAQRKIGRDEITNAREEWKHTLYLQGQHTDALEARIADLQVQVTNNKEILSRVQWESARWAKRAHIYYEIAQDYRARLARHGEQTPELPNGE